MARADLASRLLPARRACEIAELAEAVADEHCPAGLVQPQAVARDNGITISFGHYASTFDGLLEHRSGRFHIYCNLDCVGEKDSPRARFTLAHELGHYYIDEHRNLLAAGLAPSHGSQCDYESPQMVEQEADQFAGNLLMPTRRFLARARGVCAGLEGIGSLARTFGTSLTATAIRYAAADASPCAVVKWTRQGYAWKHLSTSLFQAYFRRTFESCNDLPADCPTRKALASRTPPECGHFQAGTTASAWFPRIGPGQWRDAIFIEQAIPLGRFGVLTFLYPQGGRLDLGR